MYRVFVFILVNFVWIQTVYSQIVTNANANAVQMSQTLAGAGVTILNPSTTGSPVSSAIFTSAPTSLGIESGVVLTSGAVEAQAFNPGIAGNINESPGFMNNLPGDGDLNSISAVLGETFSTLDASVLEFDIVVEGDSLIFDYVFGSEEYPDGFSNFVCSQFGDVFGFFITGPNPAGGTYNNRNIALVPNSNTPITINTINNGISGGGNANTCILTNMAYFNGQVPGMTYNGFTQVFQAFAATIPCETYHIKLAIADGDGNSGDNTLDSGVFLREGSFSSVGTTIAGSTANVLQANTAVEGCVAANFRFTIPSPLSTNYIIDFVVGGSAANNVDYANVGTQVIIPAGQTFVDLSILPFEDDLIENPEEVKIYLIHPCNTNTILDSATISIIDFENPNVSIPNDTIICQNTMMNVSAAGGVAYNWYPASAFSNTNGSNTTVITNTEQFLYVDVIDVN
ncbi:MAG: choice-of-anchor L domain-containing protein, partial [Chitinophagales bacterium]